MNDDLSRDLNRDLNRDQRACTVAVDVGNTAVKLAVSHEQAITYRAIPLDGDCWASEAIDWANNQLGCGQTRWIISSVHRTAAETLIRSIEVRPGRSDLVKVISHQDVPMPVSVDDPNALGIDRLLSAFAVSRLQETDSDRDGFVVIDAGSAITMDWIDAEGCFCGGAIMPGLRLQTKSLATGTDALPEIDWNADQRVVLPGTNTRDAIFGGILLGTAGGIDAIVTRYLGKLGSTNVVLTGGDAAALSVHLKVDHQHLPHLVCRGLLELDD